MLYFATVFFPKIDLIQSGDSHKMSTNPSQIIVCCLIRHLVREVAAAQKQYSAFIRDGQHVLFI